MTTNRIRRLTVTAVTAAALTGTVAVADGAAASPAYNGCYHGRVATLTDQLPAGDNRGWTVDEYLYRAGTSWYYTGVGARYRGTYGAWQTANGTQTYDVALNATRNSGLYAIYRHVFSTANPTGLWQWVTGYSDDLRGNTTYCLS